METYQTETIPHMETFLIYQTAYYTWSSVSAGKWETQIPALLEIRTIRIILVRFVPLVIDHNPGYKS